MSETVAANKQAVVDFHDGLRNGEVDRVAGTFAAEFIEHTGNGAVQRTAKDFAVASRAMIALGPTTRSQHEVFGELDRVAWISSWTRGGRDFSVVVVYRFRDGKIVERWPGATAPVRWEWEPTVVAGDTEATREVHRRWYDEMYATGKYLELAPQLCGPLFVRHEPTGTFSATAAEHATRLSAIGSGMSFPYEVVAEGNMVAVIGGSKRFGAFTQAWRVADGRLVESWWAGQLTPAS